MTQTARDIGVISLEEGPDPTTTLTGRVLEGSSGKPIDGAEVELNGNVVAVSGDDGRFRVSRVPIVWGSNQIQVGRLSYLYETTELWIVDPNETFDLSITLHPTPIELAGIVVEGDRALPAYDPRMRPFYERRESLVGYFFTRSEIEARDPVVFSDLLLTVPGVRVIRTGGTVRFRFSRAMQGISGRCGSPLILLDGVVLRGISDIDSVVSPDRVQGIEIYNGIARLPAQFKRPGSECGLIVIWT